MGDYRRLGLLIVIMTTVALAVGVTAIWILYETAFREERQRLTETAQSQARLLEAIVRNDLALGYNLETAVANTFSILADAHSRYDGLGESGEFTVAQRQGNSIVFLLRHREDEIDLPPTARWESGFAEPMRRALAGRSGTVVAPDYRGEIVVAAHEPVDLLDFGIVAKIDLQEIRAPFITASLTALAFALVMIAAGTALFFRIGEPMVARLRSSESRFRDLFDNMSSGVAVCEAIEDGADFVLKDINRAGQAIDQVRLGHVAGRHLSDVLPAFRELGLLDVMTRVWRSGAPERFPTTAYASGRVEGWRDNYVYKLPSGEVVVLFDDITDRKIAEEELRQAQKTEVIGQLTGGVAHDFNNVLGIVLGNLQLVRERVDADDRTNQMLDDAIWSARRGAELTKRLLAFARRQPLVPKVTNVNGLVEGMRALLTRTLGTSIRVETDLAVDAWPILIDTGQLEIAIINLAVNARDAMPDGGTLSIATRNTSVKESCPAGDSMMPAGEYVAVKVSDTGAGVPPEIVDRVFEPFFTTKSVGKGSGLGLCMVYGFVRQSGGYVTIDSAVGAGTTVTLYLPRTVPDELE